MRTRNWLSRCFLQGPMACKDSVVCLGHFLMLPHRFRWVYCQLERLRQCFPSSVRGVLAELPESLDETYERILQQIPKPNRVHAHRLLQCLVVAAYPLKVEELAEVLAIDFSGTRMTPKVDGNLRWEDKERAVLSACSSLITIVQDRGSRLVQFSHFSVKEFLTSDRLAASTVDTLRYHHIPLEAAHMMMAKVCLSILLQLENHMDKRTIRSYPLSKYAGKHFGNHVEFENGISSISDGVDKLLDGDQPHFYTWIWLQIGDWSPDDWHNSKLDGALELWHNPGMDITQHDDKKPMHPPRLPPLYYVAALGHLCLTRHIILKCSQELDVRDSQGCTPLHITSERGHSGIARLLLKFGADVDAQNKNAMTPLLLVSRSRLSIFGDDSQLPKTTQVLLEHGASVHVRDKNGQTPLHTALRHGRSGSVALLLKYGADVDAKDNDAMTPLLSVLRSQPVRDDEYPRFTEGAQLLLEHGASVSVRYADGQMPLHRASHHGLPGMAALLLKFGADVDAQDNDTMTPLLLVSQSQPFTVGQDSRYTKTAQLLLENSASVHVRNKNGQTPLHLALHHGRFDIVALLLKFGADVDAQDDDTISPLLLVSEPRHSMIPRPRYSRDEDPQFAKIAQLLLEHGASVRVRNKSGQMPLHSASRQGLTGMVALLLKFGAVVDAQDNDAMTPLLLASQDGLVDDTRITKTSQVLLEHGASVHMRNKNGQMPLHLASQYGYSGIVALLLKFGADVDAQDNDTRTPLLLVSQYDWREISRVTKTAQLLLEHGASVHLRNKNGQMPLHTALHHDLPGVVALLLKFGADVDAQDSDTMTPLQLVSQSPLPVSGDDSEIAETAQLLLEHGASVHVRNKSGQMPLHTAVQHGLSDIVELLLKFGVDVDAPDDDTMTPLLLVSQACWARESEITKTAQLLLGHGASVHARNKNGQMPIHLASQHGLLGVMQLLLKSGADVDARDNSNFTPLHFAVSSPFQRGFLKSHPDNSPLLSSVIETITLLLEHGANLQMQNDKGETPFQVAVRRGEQEIIDALSSVQNDQAI